jgi:hypothetical protein
MKELLLKNSIGISSILCILVMMLSACTSAPSPEPALTINSPQSGGVIHQIGDVVVKVQVANFKLVDKIGQANASGEGHILYFMDVTPPMTVGQPALTDPGTYVPSTETSYSWQNIGGGKHTFAVELVNNDNTPLTPPVVATTEITIIPEIGQPAMVILSPRNGAVLPSGNITVSVEVVNFNIVDKLGQPNVSHEGHLIYFLDVTAPTIPGQPAIPSSGIWSPASSTTYTFASVAPGNHTISVELVNNDDTPLVPSIVASISITVTSGGGGGLVVNSDSIITGKIVAISSSANYAWQLTVQVLSSEDVDNLPNPTKDKVGQDIICYTNDNVSLLQAGETISAHVKYAGDVPEPGIILYISNISPVQ